MSASSEYTAADSLQVLEGLDAVRKRPGMYIGTTDSRGLHHCLWEIVDNAVDEAIAGHCTAITVTLCPDGSVEVTDDGRGIPVDVEPSSGLSGVELVFTKLHAGGKFGGGGYAVSGGLHGVGASVVNALSTRLDVEVTRDGSVYSMGFAAGVSGAFDSAGTFTPTPGAPPVTIGSAPAGASGTLVRWWPDRNLFTPDAALDFDEVVSRLRQTAFLVPQVTFTLTDAREPEPAVQTLHFAGGLVDFVDWMVTAEGHKLVSDVLHLVGSGSFTERIPVITGGKTSIEDVERTVDVDVSLAWTSGYDAHVKSFVNIISTPHGGTHLVGFERGVTKATIAALRATKGIKYPDSGLVKDDVLEGLTAAVTVRLAEPQFEGQTKEVLGTKDVAGIVTTVVTESLETFFTARRTKDQARRVLEKVAAAARARIAAREVKETRRRKSALESASMPAKLVDCRSEDVSRAELFIVEGDSALGTFKQGRDSDFQAALPIRGKILNTLRATEKQMLANNECAAIIQVMGAGSGRSFDLSSVRYGRVVILTDADVDGAHIRCLLLTLIYRYMRPLLEAGMVYAAVPPLHQITVGTGKRAKHHYTYSDDQLRTLLDELRRKKVTLAPDAVQRYKGLGEMDAEQLATTTLAPGHRRLRRITVEDAEATTRMFDVTMGADVTIRRDFIVTNAAELDVSFIDA